MSAGCGDESSWKAWAASHELPLELIKLVRERADAEQGWPPGMMDEDSIKSLHEMDIRNTRFDIAISK